MHIQTLSCIYRFPWWKYTIKCMHVLQYIFLLEFIVWILHYKNCEGLLMQWEEHCIVNCTNNDFKLSSMKLLLNEKTIVNVFLLQMKVLLIWCDGLCKPFMVEGGVVWNGAC
jgi:hypothetical protein